MNQPSGAVGLQLWPGATHWPDFMNPATWTWWMEQIQGVYKDLHFDGLWIDMNEPSNYCTGDVCWNNGEHLSNAVKEPVFRAPSAGSVMVR